MEPIRYQYKFEFAKGRIETFDLLLTGDKLEPLAKLPEQLPEWTRLEFNKCSNCPLHPVEASHCPLAVRLLPIVDRMGNVVSIDEVNVKVTLDDRTVTRSATAQEGLSSLLGVVISTSGCPHTAFFKPMARFHLPFANTEETFYRAASMYMLGQYFRWQNGMAPDLELEGLLQFYREVEKVNKGLSDRLRAERREDGAVNAVVLLDMFAKSMQMTIKETLDDLAPLFRPYLLQKNP